VKALVKKFPELASSASMMEWATRILLLRYLRNVSGQFPKVGIEFVRDMGLPQFKKLYTALPEGGMLYSYEHSQPNRELLEQIFQIKWQEYVKAGKAFAAAAAGRIRNHRRA
jgi:hypothetical protein